ncbi:MAG TPA: reverse transcriptase-like protein [bacterium]|nr:reverse transcriptase-like protein [bacterium]
MTLRRRSVLYAYVAEDADGTLSLVFVDGNGRAHQLITPTPVGARTACERALRGIVYALWNARTLGYRRVVVHSDHPGAVAQVNGHCRVDPSSIGPYLEARALMHAYRWARIKVGEIRWQQLGARPAQQQQLSALGQRTEAGSEPVTAGTR